MRIKFIAAALVALLSATAAVVATPGVADASETGTLLLHGEVVLDDFTPISGATVESRHPTTGALMGSATTGPFGFFQVPLGEVTCQAGDLATPDGCVELVDPIIAPDSCPFDFDIQEINGVCFRVTNPLATGSSCLPPYMPFGSFCQAINPNPSESPPTWSCPATPAGIVANTESHMVGGMVVISRCTYPAPPSSSTQCAGNASFINGQCFEEVDKIPGDVTCVQGVLVENNTKCGIGSAALTTVYYEITAAAAGQAPQTVDGSTTVPPFGGQAFHTFIMGAAGAPGVSPGQGTQLLVSDTTTITQSGCPGGSATYVLTDFDGIVWESSPMTESMLGVYTATYTSPGFAGFYDLVITITCPDGSTEMMTSLLEYLDPSGQVFDCQGRPIEGVEVTLWRSDSETGPLTMVPDGSTIMSPDNRANPSYTTATGYYRWDTIPGWYLVKATIPGVGSVESERMIVPPERTDVDLVFDTLNCAGAPPAPVPVPPATPNGGGTPGTPAVDPSTLPIRNIIVIEPAPDPIEGEIVGGALGCRAVAADDGRMTMRVEVPAILGVWIDPNSPVTVTAGRGRTTGLLPRDRVIEVPMAPAQGEVEVTLRTHVITGAPYTVRCNVTIS